MQALGKLYFCILLGVRPKDISTFPSPAPHCRGRGRTRFAVDLRGRGRTRFAFDLSEAEAELDLSFDLSEAEAELDLLSISEVEAELDLLSEFH